MMRRPRRSTLFPYTTLFRTGVRVGAEPVFAARTQPRARRRARRVPRTRYGILAFLSARQWTPYRQGATGSTATRRVATREDGPRSKRALAGRRAAVEGRRSPRLRRVHRRADPVTRLLVVAEPRRRLECHRRGVQRRSDSRQRERGQDVKR